MDQLRYGTNCCLDKLNFGLSAFAGAWLSGIRHVHLPALKEKSMLKSLFVGALTIAVAAPVLAAAEAKYFVVREGGKDCKVTEKQPSEWEKVAILGEYASQKDAKKALKTVCAKEPPKKES